MLLVIPFLFASHAVVVVFIAARGGWAGAVPVQASYEVVRPRALRLVDISLCGRVDVVVASAATVVVVVVVVVSTIFNCVRGDFFKTYRYGG